VVPHAFDGFRSLFSNQGASDASSPQKRQSICSSDGPLDDGVGGQVAFIL
jgi:hypothetical protein